MAYKDGDLLRGPGGDTYLFDFGTRRLIPDRETFDVYGYQAAAILSISQEELDRIPVGTPLTSRRRIVRQFTAGEADDAQALRETVVIPPRWQYLSHSVTVDSGANRGTWSVEPVTVGDGTVRRIEVKVEDEPDARVAGIRVGPKRVLRITVAVDLEAVAA